MEPVSVSALRTRLADRFNRTENDRQERGVMRRNHESVVILPLRERDGMRDTLDRLSSSADAEPAAGAAAEHDPVDR